VRARPEQAVLEREGPGLDAQPDRRQPPLRPRSARPACGRCPGSGPVAAGACEARATSAREQQQGKARPRATRESAAAR
jgi:hypothetical protein